MQLSLLFIQLYCSGDERRHLIDWDLVFSASSRLSNPWKQIYHYLHGISLFWTQLTWLSFQMHVYLPIKVLPAQNEIWWWRNTFPEAWSTQIVPPEQLDPGASHPNDVWSLPFDDTTYWSTLTASPGWIVFWDRAWNYSPLTCLLWQKYMLGTWAHPIGEFLDSLFISKPVDKSSSLNLSESKGLEVCMSCLMWFILMCPRCQCQTRSSFCAQERFKFEESTKLANSCWETSRSTNSNAGLYFGRSILHALKKLGPA